MKNKIKIIFFILFASIVKAQSIVNTENMSVKSDSTFVFTTSFDGNYTAGNIELLQFNSFNQLAFKKDKNLVRLFFNYEFTIKNLKNILEEKQQKILKHQILDKGWISKPFVE